MKYIVCGIKNIVLFMKCNRHVELGPLKESIKKILLQRGCKLNIKQIAWELDLKIGDFIKPIKLALDQLISDNLVTIDNKHKFKYRWPKNVIIGTIDINNAGNGYLATELYNQDVFIHEKNRLNSLNKDMVSVQLIKGKKNKLEGRVTRVLLRSSTKFIGLIEDNGKNAFFIADNPKVGSDFFIPRDKLNAAKNKSRVIIEFTDWPETTGCPFGEVIKIIDDKIDLKTEIEANIEVFNIRHTFSEKIKQELQNLPSKIPKKDIKERKDFRTYTTFTIDPSDAKDFDDAISVKFLANNNILIGIHIADVSHYVKSSSEIDKEAFLRSFSVYFPGKVIPMLPEKISNLLCSLRPQEDKLTFSVELEISEFSKIESVWVGPAIINSNKRFSYKEAEEQILTQKGDYALELGALNKIAENFRLKRIKQGSIDFERMDVSFNLSEQGEPVSVERKYPLHAHKLVEEFMLLANKIIAEKLSNLQLSVYRVHDLPDIQKLNDLSNYLKAIKPELNVHKFSQKNSVQHINKLLRTNSSSIENLILRCMAKAKYSTKNIGHYGLGFSKYTHFTSPIRRYADLLIHRLLKKHINNEMIHLVDLEKKCIHFSNLERTYIEVERKTIKFIQLNLLMSSIGKHFEGVISGIKKWGIYVELSEGKGEGLVPTNNLTDDKYYYNENIHAFIGNKHGKKYTLGQEVIVEIKAIDLFQRTMNLSFSH